MKKPEWLKKLEEATSKLKTENAKDLKAHTDKTEIHRTIHISTVSPTNMDGEDGDIWIIYEE
jgi:hypothetical protein